MKKIFIFISLLGILWIFTEDSMISQQKSMPIGQCQMAGRGCCSRHDGVCGCKGGHTQCCDGTQSPSCYCDRDEVKGIEI